MKYDLKNLGESQKTLPEFIRFIDNIINEIKEELEKQEQIKKEK